MVIKMVTIDISDIDDVLICDECGLLFSLYKVNKQKQSYQDDINMDNFL